MLDHEFYNKTDLLSSPTGVFRDLEKNKLELSFMYTLTPTCLFGKVRRWNQNSMVGNSNVTILEIFDFEVPCVIKWITKAIDTLK